MIKGGMPVVARLVGCSHFSERVTSSSGLQGSAQLSWIWLDIAPHNRLNENVVVVEILISLVLLKVVTDTYIGTSRGCGTRIVQLNSFRKFLSHAFCGEKSENSKNSKITETLSSSPTRSQSLLYSPCTYMVLEWGCLVQYPPSAHYWWIHGCLSSWSLDWWGRVLWFRS
jgi:hypothetical protein